MRRYGEKGGRFSDRARGAHARYRGIDDRRPARYLTLADQQRSFEASRAAIPIPGSAGVARPESMGELSRTNPSAGDRTRRPKGDRHAACEPNAQIAHRHRVVGRLRAMRAISRARVACSGNLAGQIKREKRGGAGPVVRIETIRPGAVGGRRRCGDARFFVVIQLGIPFARVGLITQVVRGSGSSDIRSTGLTVWSESGPLVGISRGILSCQRQCCFGHSPTFIRIRTIVPARARSSIPYRPDLPPAAVSPTRPRQGPPATDSTNTVVRGWR